MIYNIITFIVWIVALPFLVLLSFKKKYHTSIPARFFLFRNQPLQNSQVHFHVCSLGEATAIERLLFRLIKSGVRCSATAVTKTGFDKLKSYEKLLNSKGVKNLYECRFLPFENFLPFWLKKSKILVIFEAELWLNLAKYAQKNGSYVMLLNARISDKSYKSYLKFAFYYKKVFSYIDAVFAQSQIDKERLSELGAKNISVVGNIKSCNFHPAKKNLTKSSSKQMLVLASTHRGEEELLLKGIDFDKFQVVVAPRHPERFSEVGIKLAKLAKQNSLSFEKFTQNLWLKSDIVLLDTVGDLVEFYRICDIVVLGGSFIKGIGGHNPIEIAQFKKPVISGKFIHNQIELFSLVENVKFIEASELKDELNKPLKATLIKNKFNLKEFLELIKEKL
ncbi:MAG: lipid IV(A) 3-deoxy-D-manno-octulosonic acid transferase [Campylobacter sp.]|nr:lipid IV(A) 3-deoxy-D-manno-octulosonic acid transferase [Campylobacter sp.]